MTTAEQDYQRLQQFIAEMPERLQAVKEALRDIIDNLAETIVREHSPKTLDDIRRWEADDDLAASAIGYLLDCYADEEHGYAEYALLPTEEWPEDSWCPDYYLDLVINIGAASILAIESLHTAKDLIDWADATAEGIDAQGTVPA